ncbi:MAG TPA: cysteine-rich CWC family protein [Burkholderiales bacterium]|nr:cysteine-rich CWC family protein [Burkholderiales bacterium]
MEDLCADRCARCGALFACGRNQARCWCAALPRLEPLPGRSCLCPACLAAELRERTAPDPRS